MPLDTFFRSADPACFSIELKIQEYTFFYDLEIKPEGIVAETLDYAINAEAEQLYMRRSGDSVKHERHDALELHHLKLAVDKPITSLLTHYHFDENEQLTPLKIFRSAIKHCYSNTQYHGTGYSTQASPDSVNHITKIYQQNPKIFKQVIEILKQADAGIESITIDIEKTSEGEDRYRPIFYHHNESESFPLYYQQESQGVKNLFLGLFHYLMTLECGGLLIMDEFDTHIHAEILPILVDLFLDEHKNLKHAQLVVTAHNTEIIDTSKRYRTVIAEKQDNECFLFRLDEIQSLRNDRSLISAYRKGKIGGVPEHALQQRLRKDEVQRAHAKSSHEAS